MRYRKMVSLSQQGAWTKWEGVEKKKEIYLAGVMAIGLQRGSVHDSVSE